MDYTLNGKTIRLYLGDITTVKVDAIVNSANSDLWMGSGVARAIVQAGGESIETEARKQAPCPVGHVVVTGAGTLKAEYVIHAVVMGQDFLTDQRNVKEAAEAAIAKADALALKSLAFPALSVGIGLFSSELIAKILIDAACKTLPKARSLQIILFALINEDVYRCFERALPPSFSS